MLHSTLNSISHGIFILIVLLIHIFVLVALLIGCVLVASIIGFCRNEKLKPNYDTV